MREELESLIESLVIQTDNCYNLEKSGFVDGEKYYFLKHSRVVFEYVTKKLQTIVENT
mgnify:CR=1 FL=1|jgi:hypothetical protein